MLNRASFLLGDIPAYLIFWVTQNCNARCAFCFNYEENTKKNHDLTIDEIRRVAKSIPGLKYLTLAGGEPTLRDDLADIATAFVELSSLQMCTLVTNGFKWQRVLEFVEETCRRHPKLGLNIGVSIDFVGEAHDRHRVLEGCYDGCVKVIAGIREIRKRHKNVTVGAVGTYTKANADSILETARHIIDTYEIPYHMNLVRGVIEDPALKEIDIDHYYRTAREILRLSERCLHFTTIDAPFRFALEEMAIDAIHTSVVTNKMQSKCQAGRKAAVMESNGTLRLCELLPDKFGNVRDHDYDVTKMLRSEAAWRIKDAVWENKCHCTWECFNRANIIFDAKKWPRVLGVAARKTGAMIAAKV